MSDDEKAVGRHARIPKLPDQQLTTDDTSVSLQKATTQNATIEPTSALLSDGDKAKIRAEEEYRISVKSEIQVNLAEPKIQVKETFEQRMMRSTAESNAKMEEIKAKSKLEAERKRARTPQQRKKEFMNELKGGLTLLSVVAVLLLGVYGYYSYKSQHPNSQTRLLAEVNPEKVKELCRNSVTDKARSPVDAKFNDDARPEFNGEMWMYYSYVQGQNSLGNSVRINFTCLISGQDENSLFTTTGLD